MQENLDLSNIKRIHFVGIGGIGMSALARLFLNKGFQISGSDMSESNLINDLKREGVKFYDTQKKENITNDIDLVIFTAAVPIDHPEIIEAQNLNIPYHTYAEILGQVTKDFHTIAVSGTHGKTTTTAMTQHLLSNLNLKPHAIIGSLIKKEDQSLTNYIKGDSQYFVVEACEYKKSFLNLFPKIIIITNLEEDHLDFYNDLEDIQNTFSEFVSRLPQDGYLICNTNDKNLKPVLQKAKCNIINYLDYLKDVPEMKVFGEHNNLNAACAIAVSKIINSDNTDFSGLNYFSGTWRRMEFKGQTENSNLIYDDYAHHPTEIKASLKSLKEKFPNKKINLIFQPHLYSRTRELFDDFVISLSGADNVLLAPIYAAREKFDSSISSQSLSEKINSKFGINKSIALNSFSEIKEKIKELDLNNQDLIFLTMGAGDIYQVF